MSSIEYRLIASEALLRWYTEEMTACRPKMHHVIYGGLKERQKRKGEPVEEEGEWNLAKSLITAAAIMRTQLE